MFSQRHRCGFRRPNMIPPRTIPETGKAPRQRPVIAPEQAPVNYAGKDAYYLALFCLEYSKRNQPLLIRIIKDDGSDLEVNTGVISGASIHTEGDYQVYRITYQDKNGLEETLCIFNEETKPWYLESTSDFIPEQIHALSPIDPEFPHQAFKNYCVRQNSLNNAINAQPSISAYTL